MLLVHVLLSFPLVGTTLRIPFTSTDIVRCLNIIHDNVYHRMLDVLID